MNTREAIKRIQIMLQGTKSTKYFFKEEPESTLSDIQIRAIGLFLKAYPDSYVKITQGAGGPSHYIYTTMFICPREVEFETSLDENGNRNKAGDQPRLQLRLADAGSLWLDGTTGYHDYRVTFQLDEEKDLTIFKCLTSVIKLVSLSGCMYQGHGNYNSIKGLYQKGRNIVKKIMSGAITEEEGVRQIDILRGMIAL